VKYVDAKELCDITPSIEMPVAPQIPIPNPIRTFQEGFQQYPEIMQEIAKQGFTAPTPIQCQLWPCIMKGIDVVGIAQTGSGKFFTMMAVRGCCRDEKFLTNILNFFEIFQIIFLFLHFFFFF
jgi:hypothetical protein